MKATARSKDTSFGIGNFSPLRTHMVHGPYDVPCSALLEHDRHNLFKGSALCACTLQTKQIW